MQFRLPVVVSDWRGVPSLVNDGETGFVVPARNIEPLADKLQLLCENPALAKELGQNGRNEYLINYSADTFRSNIEEAFVKVAEGT